VRRMLDDSYETWRPWPFACPIEPAATTYLEPENPLEKVQEKHL
jgi:hypothetical protein